MRSFENEFDGLALDKTARGIPHFVEVPTSRKDVDGGALMARLAEVSLRFLVLARRLVLVLCMPSLPFVASGFSWRDSLMLTHSLLTNTFSDSCR